MPARILPSVLLPAPFSPTSAWQLPRSTSKLTSSRARTPGKCLVREWKERKGMVEVKGYIVTWLYRYMVISLHGYIVTWLYRYMVISLHGYIVTWLHRYMVTSLHGYI